MPELSMPIAAPAESLPASLPAVLDGLWSRIAAALDGRWRAWALPVLVTVAEDGAPRARVLALRGVERDARRFVFHTDARSDKIRDIVSARHGLALTRAEIGAVAERLDEGGFLDSPRFAARRERIERDLAGHRAEARASLASRP